MKRTCTFLTALLAVLTLSASDGALKGKFTINANGDRIFFSQGNLQYQASTKTWRFAEHQWNFVGAEDVIDWKTNEEGLIGNVYENGVQSNNELISPTYAGWIDLFAWGKGNEPTCMDSDKRHYETFVDLGTNPISNGGNAADLWRTLTYEEWDYLLFKRTDAAKLVTTGTVNDVQGLIILPDNWKTPTDLTLYPVSTPALGFALEVEESVAGNYNQYIDTIDYDRIGIEYRNHFLDNVYTEKQWELMEANGACFLPAGGYRFHGGGAINEPGVVCNYWSASRTAEKVQYEYVQDEQIPVYAAYCVWGVGGGILVLPDEITNGCAVRLVQLAELNLKAILAAIEEAQDLYSKADKFPADVWEFNQLHTALEAAEAVVNNPDATQEDVNAATEDLQKKIDLVYKVMEYRTAQSNLQKLIDEANAYYDVIKTDFSAIAVELKSAISAANANMNAGTAAAVNSAKNILAAALQNAKNEVAAIQASKNALNTAITAATTYYNGIKDNEEYTEIASELNKAITAAQEALEAVNATKADYDKAKNELQAAENKAKEEVAKIEAEKVRQETIKTLTDSIADATAYYNELLENEDYADIAAELAEAIDAAQAVLDNPDATQEELDEAIEELEEAVAKARKAANSAHGIEEIATGSNQQATRKLFHKGNLYIQHKGKIYTATGIEIK